MSPLTETLLTTLASSLACMFVLWLVSLLRRDASIVDPFWGAGFVLVTWIAFGLNASSNSRSELITGLATIWGLRLSLFLLWRNWGHGEDRRYRAMRDANGPRFWWWSLFSVFTLQGVILWFVSFPIQATLATTDASALGWLDGLGAVVWLVGISFEAIGDWQLARFRADPANAGRVMDRGLWRYTRHPNYFGDFCIWWGIYLVAFSAGAGWTVLSPVLMSFFLLKVSGVTLLEQTITDRRPDYAAYKSRTNAFFPGPPRRARY
jgi:steroid 5-alpha reductase family enzyme